MNVYLLVPFLCHTVPELRMIVRYSYIEHTKTSEERCSVESKIGRNLALRSPYLKKEMGYDLQTTVRNSRSYELCNEV
jgi:hypothetical protein